jgi:peptidoglycan/xylan/chitin deacetylase (PgdA/CDA1 family)
MTESFVVDYAEIHRHQVTRPRQIARDLVRGAVLDGLSAFDRLTAARALARPRIQILYLHFVLRDEETRFRALIERLLTTHTFLRYSDAVARIYSGEIDKPYIALTFDDGLRNCLRAAEILDEYGLSACFFVCDSMADERRYDVIRDFCARELSMPAAEFLSWRDMEGLLARGHEIGNHSRRHKTLAELGPAELEEDVAASLASLRARLGDVKHFAWPRGEWRHFNAESAAAVFRAGHASCASAERGAHVPAGSPAPHQVCLRRDHVIAAWPVRHSLHFIIANSRKASPANTSWPEGWLPRIEAALP